MAYTGHRESVVADLGVIFRKLIPSEQQTFFREAIGEALLNTINDDTFPEESIRDLLSLSGEVGALQSLYCLPRVAAKGRYQAEFRWMQYHAIGVLKQLMPAPLAIKALSDLAAEPEFDVRFSFDVLTTLVSHDPDRWMSHMAHMYSRIVELYRQAFELDKKDGDTKCSAVGDVMAAHRQFEDVFARRVSVVKICDAIRENSAKLIECSGATESCAISIDLLRNLESRKLIEISYRKSTIAGSREIYIRRTNDLGQVEEATSLVDEDVENVLKTRIYLSYKAFTDPRNTLDALNEMTKIEPRTPVGK
jgi:hypothetical protein